MIKKFIVYYKPYKKTLALVILGSLMASSLDLLFPMAIRHILNVILPEKNMNDLLFYGMVLGVLYVVNYFIVFFVNYYGHTLSAKIENNMRKDLFRHLQFMSFKYFDNARTGQLLSRLTSDISEIGELSFRGPNDIIICSITMLGTIGVLFWMNLPLGLLIASLLIIKTIHTIYVNRKMKIAFRENRAKNGELTAQAQESLSGIRLVKAFARENYQLQKFWEKCLDLLKTRKKSYKILAHFSGSVTFFTNLVNLMVMLVGGYMIIHNQLLLSDFVAFLLYVNLFMKPLLRLTVFAEMYQRGMAGFHRFNEVMREKPEISDASDVKADWPIRGEISFENVSFAYTPDREVIRNLNLKIKPGETVAFVGETGVGKTTIANMLLRFYEPTSGRITIDGVDITKMHQSYLRENIGLVQQDVFLFSDSVYNNIAFGKPEANEVEVIEAAKSAAADTFINRLPEGYKTEIGERGVKLSGGQKQRLAIARMFLKKPPIVVLDEATSSLDNRTEKLIQEALERLILNRTTLIIAHRMTTVINADKIVVLSNQGIAEMGTHEELIKSKGLYYKLYMSQS
ncbi:MAG TPA: ABC transporter ATP-binding protein [Candidatus Avacidaminococcus intestinavium]|uniref:ABC transporter ATP-binding protein n=1 Tax=Candidatus Avacidaminococcus intestinavium TaxID=2840684 RepID=A0A9D1MNU3_9FIRM|nr:ABC transporter ATP-binding protein [Candidatus Avacidaminococcus intestinavium]